MAIHLSTRCQAAVRFRGMEVKSAVFYCWHSLNRLLKRLHLQYYVYLIRALS